MIGSMLEGKHKGKPILIFTVLNATPHPKALFVRADGTMGEAPITEVSVDWNYSAERQPRWQEDFPLAES